MLNGEVILSLFFIEIQLKEFGIGGSNKDLQVATEDYWK